MFSAYTIGVKLSLIDGASSALAGIAGAFTLLHRQQLQASGSLAAYEARLKSIKATGLAGGLALGAGLFGLKMLDGPLEEAKKFQTEVAKFKTLGFGDTVTTQATRFAEGMQTIGTSARDNMTLVADAMAVFKNLDHAEMAAPIMAKMKFANEAIFGKEGGSANDRKFMDMLKVIEFRGGLKSDAEFATQANFVQQVISGSRNRVDAGQLLSALKTGGVALSQRQNAEFYLGSEPLIQEFGGQRYGTGAMSIYQNLVQSRGTITAQQELNRLGLLDQDKIEFNKLGQLKKALPGSFIGSEVLEKQGELALLEKVLLPAFKAKGIEGDEAVIRELGMILGNRTGSSLMSRIYQQRETLHTQIDANRSAENIDQATTTASGTLAGKEIDLHAKWATVLKELGTTILPLAIKAVEGLTVVLRGVVAFTREYPGLTKTVMVAGALLATLMTIGGAALLARTGIAALSLALSFSGLGGAPGIVKMASAFSMAGIALSSLFKIAAAGAAGYAVGSVVYKTTEDSKFMSAVGQALGHTAAFFGNKEAQEAVAHEQRYLQQQHEGKAGTTPKPELRGFYGQWSAAESAKTKTQPAPLAALATQPAAPRQDLSFLGPFPFFAPPKMKASVAETSPPVPEAKRSGAGFLAPLSFFAPQSPKPGSASISNPAASPPSSQSKRAAPSPIFAPLTIKYPPPSPAPASMFSPTILNNVSVMAPPSAKFPLPATATTSPSTQNNGAYMTMRPNADTAPRIINVTVDGRVIARAVDDQVNRATASGAGMGTTQFDPSFSVPPLALPGGAK